MSNFSTNVRFDPIFKDMEEKN